MKWDDLSTWQDRSKQIVDVLRVNTDAASVFATLLQFADDFYSAGTRLYALVISGRRAIITPLQSLENQTDLNASDCIAALKYLEAEEHLSWGVDATGQFITVRFNHSPLAVQS